MGGAAWTILTGVVARGLGLVGTLVLTHFLAPDVQGEVSDAFIVVLTAHMVTSLGVLHFLVARPKDATPEVGWHVTVIHLATGVVALLAVVALRDRFGAWLSAPTMGRYVPGFALAIFFERISNVPERLLARQMRFRAIGGARGVSEITYSLTSVGLAALGVGGMAIVWGNVARGVMLAIAFSALAPRDEWLRPTRLKSSVYKPVLRFGVPLGLGAFASFASRRWDNLIISAMFGAGVVGEYNLAYNLADIPAIQVGEQIGETLLPSFAHMTHEERKDAIVRSSGLLSVVVFPLAVGLGAIADSLVRTLLPEKWLGVAPMLVILSALSVARPFGFVVASYLQASNRPNAAMWLFLAKIVLLVAGIVSLGQLGPLWACGGVGVAFGLQSVMAAWFVARADGVRLGAILAGAATPLLACVPMVAAVLGVRSALAQAGVHAPAVSLIAEIVAGAGVYVVSAFVVARGPTRDLLGVVRDARERRRSKA